jgi:hypothetical protein
VFPAIVAVPESAPPLLGAAVSVTVPLPVPLPPLVTVNQLALLAAVHPHALFVVTEIVAVPPLYPNCSAPGEMAALHETTGTAFTDTWSIVASAAADVV